MIEIFIIVGLNYCITYLWSKKLEICVNYLWKFEIRITSVLFSSFPSSVIYRRSSMYLKVIKFRKQFMVFSILRIKTNELHSGQYPEWFRSFFGRFKETLICFRDCLTFRLLMLEWFKVSNLVNLKYFNIYI